MSYQVCHMEKLKRGDVRGILEHLTHDKDSSQNGDIEKSLTKKNIDLVTWRYMPSDSQRCGLWQHNTYQRLKAVLEQRKNKTKALRKDATLVCSFVIGSDNEKIWSMDEKTRNAYFKECYNFFCNRYGKDNVLFAVVHNDELTPQLHLGVIPMKDGRLTAKTIFDRVGLRTLQTDLAEKVGKSYGLKRGIEGSTKKHIKEAMFKYEKLYKANESLKQAISDNIKQLKSLNNQLDVPSLNSKEKYVYSSLKKKFPKTTKEFELEFEQLQKKDSLNRANKVKQVEKEVEQASIYDDDELSL